MLVRPFIERLRRDERLRHPVVAVVFAGVASLALWQAWWPLAALALAGLVVVPRESRLAVTVDAIVFFGLAGQAEPIAVLALVALSWISGRSEPRTMAVILLASVAAIALPVDWTILTAILALHALWRASRSALANWRRG